VGVAGPEFLIALVYAVPLLFVWLMVRRPSNRSVAAFAKTYSVPLTSHNVEQLRRYIRWTRRWRLGGVVAFNIFAAAYVIVTEREPMHWAFPLVLGYSVGSLLAELFRPVDRPAQTSTATLSQRRIGDYVAPGFLIAVGVMFVTSLVPAAYLLLTNEQRPWTGRAGPPGVRPQDWYVIALVAVAAVMALLCRFGGRTLAQASVPADTPDRQAARHAIRSAAIMSVVGGTTMVIGVIGAKLASTATTINSFGAHSSTMSWLMTMCVSICGLGAFGGAMLTLTTIPRVALFSGALPSVPLAEPRAEV
jgi:hypothetical protein